MSDFDLVHADPRDRYHYLIGWAHGRCAGYVEGVDVGREHERDEAAQLWAEARRVILAAAASAPRDVEADERRAERSRQWWRRRRENPQPQVESVDERRGEGMSA